MLTSDRPPVFQAQEERAIGDWLKALIRHLRLTSDSMTSDQQLGAVGLWFEVQVTLRRSLRLVVRRHHYHLPNEASILFSCPPSNRMSPRMPYSLSLDIDPKSVRSGVS